jgi:hypothetical protein
MADNIPNLPSGAVPPKPSEPAKVQPKKETVRINLPPKPSASPTIKLPTIPAGGPPPPTAAAAPAAAPSAPTAPAPAPAPAVQPPRPPTAARPASAGATTSARVAGSAPAVAAAPRPAPAPASRHTPAPQVSGVDKGLAIGAAVISVLALASVLFLMIVENAS